MASEALINDASSSNKEGEMPSWEIPSSWINPSAISAEKVVLYENGLSPPCCKIRSILNYYGIEYSKVTGKKPDSEYKKIPVLMIGDRQINDSYIIIRVLAQALQGVPLTEQELEIENLTTNALMLSLEVDVMESAVELQKCMCEISPILCCVLWPCSLCLPCCLSSGIRSKHPHLKNPTELGVQYASFLGDSLYFHGSEVGVVDCSVYGVLEPFRKVNNAAFHAFLGSDSRLTAWHARMQPLVPDIFK